MGRYELGLLVQNENGHWQREFWFVEVKAAMGKGLVVYLYKLFYYFYFAIDIAYQNKSLFKQRNNEKKITMYCD